MNKEPIEFLTEKLLNSKTDGKMWLRYIRRLLTLDRQRALNVILILEERKKAISA